MIGMKKGPQVGADAAHSPEELESLRLTKALSSRLDEIPANRRSSVDRVQFVC
jgi:hypothetical protein